MRRSPFAAPATADAGTADEGALRQRDAEASARLVVVTANPMKDDWITETPSVRDEHAAEHAWGITVPES